LFKPEKLHSHCTKPNNKKRIASLNTVFQKIFCQLTDGADGRQASVQK